jgi:hypothetical protein
VQHGLKFQMQANLELGGPFLLQDAGGMMVATKEVSREEFEAYAAQDWQYHPACWYIRPWLTAMEHKRIEES